MTAAQPPSQIQMYVTVVHALRRATANLAIATPNVTLRESPPHLFMFVVTCIANLLVDPFACVVGAIPRLVAQYTRLFVYRCATLFAQGHKVFFYAF